MPAQLLINPELLEWGRRSLAKKYLAALNFKQFTVIND